LDKNPSNGTFVDKLDTEKLHSCNPRPGTISSIHKLQGKDPLAKVFAEAPIKIAQKSIYNRRH
jgi:hypothetical protein